MFHFRGSLQLVAHGQNESNQAGRATRVTGGSRYIACPVVTRELTDSHIEEWVLQGLRAAPALHSKELCVLCSNGVITLFGTAVDEGSRYAAVRVAGSAPGVVAVENRIRLSSAVGTNPTPLVARIGGGNGHNRARAMNLSGE